MIDVVGPEAGPHQLLEQVGLLVRALGRAEPGERVAAAGVADAGKPGGGGVERLLPARLSEQRQRVRRVEALEIVLADAVPPDHRRDDALRMVHVVEPEPALDAQPAVIGGAVPPLDLDQPVVLDVVGELAADAAIGAEAVDGPVRRDGARRVLVHHRRRHQRPGGACLDALAAGDAGAVAHRIVEIEDDLRFGAAMGHADHVVDLDLAAGAYAERAVDAGVQVDRHRGVARVGVGRRLAIEAAGRDPDPVGPLPQLGVRVVSLFAPRLVGDQELEHHAPRRGRAFRGGVNRHALARHPDARRREHALALDLDHAGAAIAVGAIAGLGRVAEMRDLDAEAMRDLPDGFARLSDDPLAVEREGDPGVLILWHRLTVRYVLGEMPERRQ